MSTNEARAVLVKRLNAILDDRWPLAGKIMSAVDEYVALERSAGAADVDALLETFGDAVESKGASYNELEEAERSAGAAPLDVETLAKALHAFHGLELWKWDERQPDGSGIQTRRGTSPDFAIVIADEYRRLSEGTDR